jgi:hypothetical protein
MNNFQNHDRYIPIYPYLPLSILGRLMPSLKVTRKQWIGLIREGTFCGLFVIATRKLFLRTTGRKVIMSPSKATILLLLFRCYCHDMSRSYDHHQAADSGVLSQAVCLTAIAVSYFFSRDLWCMKHYRCSSCYQFEWKACISILKGNKLELSENEWRSLLFVMTIILNCVNII